jgi:hypothetical protein
MTEDNAHNDPLYRAAFAVEKQAKLAAKMAKREPATVGDGLFLPEGTRPGIRALLSHPESEDVEFEPPRLGRSKPRA